MVVVQSHGRLMFSEQVECLFRQAEYLKQHFPVVNYPSPYWGIGLEKSIKLALGLVPSAKYILFTDGDSVWEPNDLKTLYDLIDNSEIVDQKTGATCGIDAIFPTQADRNSNKPLAYNWIPEAHRYDYSQPVMYCPHGHFGLTLIRRDVFEAVDETGSPRFKAPYALGVPSENGFGKFENGGLVRNAGELDPDTYFWLKMKDAGFRAYNANCVVIGHMQLGVRWQRGTDIVWQQWYDWKANGKPIGTNTPRPEDYEKIGQIPGHAVPVAGKTQPEPEDEPMPVEETPDVAPAEAE